MKKIQPLNESIKSEIPRYNNNVLVMRERSLFHLGFIKKLANKEEKLTIEKNQIKEKKLAPSPNMSLSLKL